MNEEAVLPKAYAPFAPVLELLPRPLAQVLRGQLAQFEPLARGLEQREFALQGDFEGLGGLTHHGAIDHILQSELLLRTEAPLDWCEFQPCKATRNPACATSFAASKNSGAPRVRPAA